MPERKPAFIKVDELLPQITLEQAARYYGVSLPEIRQVGDEIRMRCFLACGRTEETSDRAIAVQANNPVKPWKCHVYSCQKGGNLVGLLGKLKVLSPVLKTLLGAIGGVGGFKLAELTNMLPNMGAVEQAGVGAGVGALLTGVLGNLMVKKPAR